MPSSHQITYLQIPIWQSTASPEAAAAVRTFFDAQTNFKRFYDWHAVEESLSPQPLLRAWFYSWCYQNITVRDSLTGVLWQLHPCGFEGRGKERVVSVSRKEINFWHDSIPIESATLSIPDPTWLYQKFGI
jgi:hypothetical protein